MPTGLVAGGFAVKFSRNAMLVVLRDRSHHGSINNRLSIFCWFAVLLPIYQIWDNSNLGHSKEIIFLFNPCQVFIIHRNHFNFSYCSILRKEQDLLGYNVDLGQTQGQSEHSCTFCKCIFVITSTFRHLKISTHVPTCKS